VQIKHLDSQQGNYAPQGDIYGREKRKMGNKGLYIITALALLGLAYACTAQAEATEAAMVKCQVKHSFDVCYEKLRG
jgi:hypothetical protein